jgi:hypothetical protein
MKKIFVLSIVLVASLVAAPALADRLTHKVAQVEIDVPHGWKQAGSKVLTIGDPDDEVAVTFVVVPTGAVAKAAKAAGKQLAKMIKRLKIGRAAKITLNGMPGVKIEGSGRIDDKMVEVLMLVLDTPSDDHDLMVIAIGEKDKISKHKRSLKHVFDHISPLKSHRHHGRHHRDSDPDSD